MKKDQFPLIAWGGVLNYNGKDYPVKRRIVMRIGTLYMHDDETFCVIWKWNRSFMASGPLLTIMLEISLIHGQILS